MRLSFWSALLVLAMVFGCSGAAARRASVEITAWQVEWEQYHEAETDDRFEAALAGYQSMCERRPPYPRACYDRSRLLFALERDSQAVERSLDFVRRFADHALAPTAIKRLARHYAGGDAIDQGIRTLSGLTVELDETPVCDSILYQLAWLQRHDGRTVDEGASLAALLARHDRWESQLWDDAIWRLIEIRQQQSAVEEQYRLLHQLLETRESSWLIGSYTSPHHDDALLMLGKLLHRERRDEEAIAALMELAELPSSRLRDEGLFFAAQVRFDQGRERDGCLLLKRLIDEMEGASMRRRALAESTINNCEL